MQNMIQTRKGKILRILSSDDSLLELRVEVEGKEAAAVAYPRLTGPVDEGDEVLLNTTAVELGLGSGGVHFVMANLTVCRGGNLVSGAGHIMKMNYTPMQCRVLSVEEPDSAHHEVMRDFEGLGGTPVVAGSLHSMVAPLCASLGRLGGGRTRVVYVMTDAACLPGAFSRTVRILKDKGLLAGVVTYGHAFGGDVEAVNKFTAFAAAKAVLGADVIVAAMGVGSIGTGTRYGHTGMEQGELINAVAAMGGAAVAVPRISFADRRERHRGVSHHTLAALGRAALARAVAPLPALDEEKMLLLRRQYKAWGIYGRHTVRELSGEVALEALEEFGVEARTMGRGPEKDREFFLACGAAARAAAELLP